MTGTLFQFAPRAHQATHPVRRVSAFAPWLGSTGTMARSIIDLLGPHYRYYEPFVGGGAVLLAKDRADSECINDANGELVNMLRVIASKRWRDFADRVWRLGYGQHSFDDCKAIILASPPPVAGTHADVDEVHVERAACAFVLWWAGAGGQAGMDPCTARLSVRFKQGGGQAATRFRTAFESIAWFRERLTGGAIMRTDAVELLHRIADDDDRPGVTIYVDPPYILEGHLYQVALDDLQPLAEALHRFRRARIVLSYNAHPWLDETYADWTQLDATCTRRIGTGGGAKADQSPARLFLHHAFDEAKP